MVVIRSQSALEFMVTYAWALIIVLLMLSVLAYFVLYPGSIVPPTCSFTGALYCADIIVTTNSVTHNTILYLNVSNEQDYPIENPTLTVQLSASNKNTTATCFPYYVPPGGSMLCVLPLPIKTHFYQTIYGTLFLNSSQCGLSVNYSAYSANCTAPPSGIVLGSFHAQATYSLKFRVGTIYCVGTAATSPYNLSYYSALYDDGSLGIWVPTTNYPTPLMDSSCSVYDNNIYCVGGYNGITATNASYFAPVTSSGIGNWSATTPYPMGLDYAGCSTYNNYIYCVGTDSTPPYNYSFYATVSQSGIGAWSATTPYPLSNSSNSCSIFNGYIYCVGVTFSAAAKKVYYAPVSAGGIGAWTQSAGYPQSYSNVGCTAYQGYLYCQGSSIGNQQSKNSWYAQITGDGSLGAWIPSTAYPIKFYGGGCSIYDGYVYCVGDQYANPESVYYAPITSNSIGSWTLGTQYPISMYDSYCAVSGISGGYYS